MTYPNITDERTRKAIAKTLWKWHKDKNTSSTLSFRYLIKEWIYGFRRALEIVNDP